MRVSGPAGHEADGRVPCPHRFRIHAGLTLVELLVAISVLAMVAMLGWRGLDGILRARDAITLDIEQTRGMQLTFAQLESDCAHLAPAALVVDRPTLLAADGRLALVRTVFADDQPTRVQAVVYRWLNGKLTRRESVPSRDLKTLDAAWLAALSDTDESATAVVMQSDVSALAVRSWTSDGLGWRTGVVEIGPATGPAGTVRAPVTGLEIALQLQGQPGRLVKTFLLGAL